MNGLITALVVREWRRSGYAIAISGDHVFVIWTALDGAVRTYSTKSLAEMTDYLLRLPNAEKA